MKVRLGGLIKCESNIFLCENTSETSYEEVHMLGLPGTNYLRVIDDLVGKVSVS